MKHFAIVNDPKKVQQALFVASVTYEHGDADGRSAKDHYFADEDDFLEFCKQIEFIKLVFARNFKSRNQDNDKPLCVALGMFRDELYDFMYEYGDRDMVFSDYWARVDKITYFYINENDVHSLIELTATAKEAVNLAVEQMIELYKKV